MTEILTNINWVDILILIVFAGIICTGFKSSFAAEFLKILGTFCALFVTLHYYITVSVFLYNKLHFLRTFAEVTAFVFLWMAVTVIFALIRMGLLLVFRIETHPGLDRWAGITLAGLRALLVCSMILTLMYVTQGIYVKKQVKRSVTGRHLHLDQWAVRIYQAGYESMVSKFFPTEKLNTKALALTKENLEAK